MQTDLTNEELQDLKVKVMGKKGCDSPFEADGQFKTEERPHFWAINK
jgi:hypothetical protein